MPFESMDEWQERLRREDEERTRRSRRFHIAMGIGFGSFILGLVAFVWWVVQRDRANYDTFMQGCLKDHKQYECMAMWRAGERSPYPIFIPVPIPTGR